ncbi:uncharacterized protein BO97DRAFT_402748 [Aspergillus homomorphus CBS 101889]|uniref:Uncharacterized protein n=1 Tax=Aspergillus homomorphus (strain CBS 101889) TaxID=1450537 RepID=A0A395IB15_ASPHC|nr:hypothetical protein BO97DRAFT_402748 [Aspergillus homomorphus CBS 101889]RAL16323.1 hypothetical protein BO97DRAFT_402748 [Aspergillus homomorphus CBS 101889]
MRHLVYSLPGRPSIRSHTAISRWRPQSARSFCRSARLASVKFSNYTVDIPVGNNGHIKLEIIHPSSVPIRNGDVIIHLPPGPLFTQPEIAEKQASKPPKQQGKDEVFPWEIEDAPNTSLEHASSPSTFKTIVTINYRLGLSLSRPSSSASQDAPTSTGPETRDPVYYQFPTPIHDTLAGFDWIQQNLQPRRVGVTGTHIGGSLALMLALTEAQTIHAVAALEPVCNWADLDDHCMPDLSDIDDTGLSLPTEATTAAVKPGAKRTATTSNRNPPAASSDLVRLLEARKSFFTSPERYFDAFASPMLFLRPAGKSVPLLFPDYLTGPGYPIPVPRQKSEQELFEENVQKYFPGFADSSLPASIARPKPAELLLYLDKKAIADAKKAAREAAKLAAMKWTNQGTIIHRKKVLRWPSYGPDDDGDESADPEECPPEEGLPPEMIFPGTTLPEFTPPDVTLPWVRIYTRGDVVNRMKPEKPTRISIKDRREFLAHRMRKRADCILTHQAVEMVDTMRRACFWGREKAIREKRVSWVEVKESAWPDSAERYAGNWLLEVMNGPEKDLPVKKPDSPST